MNRPADQRKGGFLAGRERELAKLVDLLRRGRHTLLVGERGVGKSRLMREAATMLEGRRTLDSTDGGLEEGKKWSALFIWHCAPMSDCLKEICHRLLQQERLRTDLLGEIDPREWGAMKKKLTGLGTVGVQNLVLESLRCAPGRTILFFDSLDRITVASQQFFEDLLSVAVCCAAVVSPKEGMRKFWSSFTRITLLPLTDGEAEELIDHLLEEYSLHLIDRRMFVRGLIKASGGNPFHIRTMLDQGSREKHLGEEEIRSLQRVEVGEFMNMGPAYIFLASIFTLSKIFSAGADRTEFYVYFSALGFLVYLTFRVFRTFFLFRPQRWER
jgi:hypothetical protein